MKLKSIMVIFITISFLIVSIFIGEFSFPLFILAVLSWGLYAIEYSKSEKKRYAKKLSEIQLHKTFDLKHELAKKYYFFCDPMYYNGKTSLGESQLMIDKTNLKLAICNNFSVKKIFDIDNILNIDFNVYNTVDVNSNNKNLVERSIVGGVLAGQTGAIIGGTTSQNISTTNTQESFILIQFDDLDISSFQVMNRVIFGKGIDTVSSLDTNAELKGLLNAMQNKKKRVTNIN